ncbi:uncharacterized protein ATNIH1004_007647 [Aspergillus tanneri]|uniref:Uncharacterized protein n=1 Tax=Aspergillus tanneri TaxID=1220188 RepID=A0A5M9MLP4_9EURO|nr:uncharacterized protein ATNIH1004_007647 [Aspergillus tanneri]KAA8646220.1 hypothetical protein ATNIH1004_007647 [Aspergillus tanneri]
MICIQGVDAFGFDALALVHKPATQVKRQIIETGNPERRVDGDFVEYESGGGRSCGDQFDICQGLTNADTSLSVPPDCQRQLTMCLSVQISAPIAIPSADLERNTVTVMAQTRIPYDEEFDLHAKTCSLDAFKLREFQTNTATSTRSKTSPSFAQRYATTISNPLSRTLTTPTARRTLFLNRVRRDRHDGRFETRGEQLALMEHVAEERKWDASMKRHADGIFEGYLRDLETSEFEPEFESGDGSEIGDVAGMDLSHLYCSGPDGSFSDEEYDHIFMDLVHSTQDMDMSG